LDYTPKDKKQTPDVDPDDKKEGKPNDKKDDKVEN